MVLPPFLDFRRSVRDARDAILAQMDPSTRLFHTASSKFDNLLADLPDIELPTETGEVPLPIGWGECGGVADMKQVCRRLVFALQENKRLLKQTRTSFYVVQGQVKSKNVMLDYMRKTMHGEVVALKQMLLQQQHGILTPEDVEGLMSAQFSFLDSAAMVEAIGATDTEPEEAFDREKKHLETQRLEVVTMIKNYGRDVSAMMAHAMDFEHQAMMAFIGAFMDYVPDVVRLYATEVHALRVGVQTGAEHWAKERSRLNDALAEATSARLSLEASMGFVTDARNDLAAEVARLTLELEEGERKVAIRLEEAVAEVREDTRRYKFDVRDSLMGLHSLFHDGRLQRSAIHRCLEEALTTLGMEFRPIAVKPEPVVVKEVVVKDSPPPPRATRSVGVGVPPGEFGPPPPRVPSPGERLRGRSTQTSELGRVIVKSVLHDALERATREVGVECTFLLDTPAVGTSSVGSTSPAHASHPPAYALDEVNGELRVNLEAVVGANLRPNARVVRRVVAELCTILHREATRNTGCMWRLASTDDGVAVFKKLVCLEAIDVTAPSVVHAPPDHHDPTLHPQHRPSACAAQRWARLPRRVGADDTATPVPLTPTGRSAGSGGVGRSILVPAFQVPVDEVPAWPNMPPAQRIRRSRAAGVAPEVVMRPMTPVPRHMYHGKYGF